MPTSLLHTAIRSLSNLSAMGAARGPHITRYTMYRSIMQHRVDPPRTALALSISGSEGLCRLLGFTNAQIISADYPGVNLLALPFPNCTFDCVVSDQVLEHVRGNPQQAIDESRRVLKDGGLAVHTTCFINPIHLYPDDYWRFTPEALTLLCGDFAKILEAGGWGNPYAWFAIGLGLHYEGVPERHWHPLHRLAIRNDPAWPIMTWIVARR